MKLLLAIMSASLLTSCGMYRQHIAPHDLDFTQSEFERLTE